MFYCLPVGEPASPGDSGSDPQLHDDGGSDPQRRSRSQYPRCAGQRLRERSAATDRFSRPPRSVRGAAVRRTVDAAVGICAAGLSRRRRGVAGLSRCRRVKQVRPLVGSLDVEAELDLSLDRLAQFIEPRVSASSAYRSSADRVCVNCAHTASPAWPAQACSPSGGAARSGGFAPSGRSGSASACAAPASG